MTPREGRTVTSLGIVNFLSKNGVRPQAVPGRDENVKLFTRDSDVIGRCKFYGEKPRRSSGSPQEG